MKLSESARESGWFAYPADVWDERKPVHWLHDWPFWEACARQFAGNDPILDLACGNGRITRQLVLAGYRVVAVDVNPHFLNRAVDHMPETTSDQVEFVLSDVVHLDLGRRFRLVIMADWAFPALLKTDELIAFFHRLAQHMLPGGAFVFNTPLFGIGPGTAEDFDVIGQVGIRRSGPVEIKLRYATLGEIELLAFIGGFTILEVYGGTDRRPLHGRPGDDLTVILRKPDA
ncbi:MAG: class I SAM-dependent methyltransferase [Chloroflexi bacterium]|nr:class I SAM-dependent methyltransferase [Chloroflexota bacterium]